MIAAAGRRTHRFALPRASARVVSLIALAVVLIGCGWLWFRGSSFVAIQRVEVTGLTGPNVPQIRRALISEAERMTTLEVDMARLDNAVSQYSVVHSLAVTAHFPHSLVIAVNEQVPVATVRDGGQTVVVDTDGYLLRRVPVAGAKLPSIPLREIPDGPRLTSAGSRAAVRTLAAAPYQLLSHIAGATTTAAHGVIIQLRNGPQIYFGSPSGLKAKWASAVAVLGVSNSVGATYIDVTDPRRPAAGG